MQTNTKPPAPLRPHSPPPTRPSPIAVATDSLATAIFYLIFQYVRGYNEINAYSLGAPHIMLKIRGNQTHPVTTSKRAKDLRDSERETQQLRDIDEGVGFSSDKVLARYYGTTRKTIWCWSKDPVNPFPTPKKISRKLTRWDNAEIKAHRNKQLVGRLYG